MSCGPYLAVLDHEFEKTLHLLCGDKYYLQASEKGFRDLIGRIQKDESECYVSTITQADSHQLLAIAKRALEKGELDIAEKSLTMAIKTEKLTSNDKNTEPYILLAEIHEKKADDKSLPLLERQRFLLQATALYNFVLNCLKTTVDEQEQSSKTTKTVFRKLHDIQDRMVLLAGGKAIDCSFDVYSKRDELKQLRGKIMSRLAGIDRENSSKENAVMSELDYRDIFVKQTAEVKELCEMITLGFKDFFAGIIEECLKVLGEPPCYYEVIVLGSSARGEMTPFSDLEWAILVSSDEDHCKVFFRNLTNLVHFKIINLGETILPSMDIKALKTDWFFDDITPRGLSFDAFLPQACKTPLGNMKDFELIHSPKRMAEFQNDVWYERNMSLAEILMTVSPLEDSKHDLIDKYRKEIEDILNLPCDKHEHDDERPSTREACRGFNALHMDLFRYGDAAMTGYNEFDEGKLYDVKKEIYRLTDRVISGMAKCLHVQANGALDIIDELLEKGLISPDARDNLASASAIALKLRISTYLKAGKQGEELRAKPTDESVDTIHGFHMPQNEELFHFFYVAIPLYEELCRVFSHKKDFKELSQDVFFDCSSEVKANIYSRVLDYTKAVECYDLALKTDPDNVNMEIRQIRLMLIINEHTESIRNKVDGLLDRIFDDSCPKESEVSPNDAQLDRFLFSVEETVLRQLLEILIFLSAFESSSWYFKLAEKLLSRCMAIENMEHSHLLMADYAFSHFYAHTISSSTIDSAITILSAMIDNEGISTKSISCLNKLAEIFTVKGNYNKSYNCLQRALTMERTLYGTSPNLNVMKTLYQLGMLSVQLFMFKEGEFYLRQLLQQFDSFGGLRPRLMYKHAYLLLAILYSSMDRREEAITHLEKALELATDRKHAIDKNFDCIIHCEMAKLWHSLKNEEQIKKCVQNAKEYLSRITSIESRMTMSCYVAMTFHEVGMNDESISLLNEEIHHADIQAYAGRKAPCLVTLGRISNHNNQTVEAEKYYLDALENFPLLPDENSVDGVLECLLEVSDVLVGNGKPLEGRKRLEDAQRHLSTMNDQHKKCKMLREVGERWERFGKIHLALNCFNEALRLCKENTMSLTNIPFTEFSLEVKLGDLCAKGNVGKNDKEYESFVTKEQRVAAQRKHYESAGSLLQQYSTRGNYDTLLIELFLLLASKYATIDVEEMEKHLSQALQISDVFDKSVIGNDIVSLILFRLFYCYFLKGEYTSGFDILERSIRIEMEEHTTDPFHPHICCRLVFFSVLLFLNSSTNKDIIELLLELFQSELSDDGFARSSVTVKANAAHCFTFLSLLFWCYHEHERAQMLNGIALELFEEIQDQGIPGNRWSSQVVCNKMRKVLEQPNNKHAVVELLQSLSVSITDESDMYAFLDEYSTRGKVKIILDSIVPQFFHGSGVDMLSFLPRFISLYDQYSPHIDVAEVPHLPVSMEVLRQLCRNVYGENPVTSGEALTLNDMVEILPSAKNLVSSMFSNSGSGTSFMDQVKEKVAETGYGAVTDNSIEDLFANAFNVASSLLTGGGGNGSVLSSLLSRVELKTNDSETTPAPTQRKISISSVQDDCSSRDFVNASGYAKNSAKNDELGNDVRVSETVKREKDSVAALIGKQTASVDLVKEGKNRNGGNVDGNSAKRSDIDSLHPASFIDIYKYMVGQVLGKEIFKDGDASPHSTSPLVERFKTATAKLFENNSDLDSGNGDKGNGPSTSVEPKENKDIDIEHAYACSPSQMPQKAVHGETAINGSCQGQQRPLSTQLLPDLIGDFKSVETHTKILKDLQQKYEAMRTMLPVIQKLTDSANEFLQKGELQKYMETNDKISTLVKSFVKLVPPDTVIEKLLSNAEEEMKKCKVKSLRSRLNFAAQFPKNDRQNGWFSKINGDCYLLEGDYRLAASNYTRASDYYSSYGLQDPGGILAYLETLVGLIKSHILCQKLEDAWQVCQNCMAALTQLGPDKIPPLQTMQFHNLSAKCLLFLKDTDDNLNTAASFCQQGLAAGKVADDASNNTDITGSLGKNGDVFAQRCETQLLLARILQRLDKNKEAEAILTDMQSFLLDVAVGFETYTETTWEGGNLEFFKISSRLYAWIGRTFVLNKQTNSSISWLAKSLSAFVTSKRMDIATLHEELIPLLDAIATTEAVASPDNDSFQRAIDMCKREILKQHGDVVTVYGFMVSLALLYMEIERAREAIVVYETALTAAECMSDSVADQRRRAFMELHLGHAHRVHANNNTGEERSRERDLARKYYETGENMDFHSSSLCKKLSLACWQLEKNEFIEAIGLLYPLLEIHDKLANVPVVLGFSSRFFYGPAIKGYIEEHGECMTTFASLVFSVAVFVYAELGLTSDAITTCEKLSTQRDLNGILGVQPSVNSYLLAACHRKLSFLIDDGKLEDRDFPLSPLNLAKLYYEAGHYEGALKYCSDILKSVESPVSELDSTEKNALKLDCMHIVGNTLIQTGNHDKCASYFVLFLEILHEQKHILDLEFEKQCAVLEEYSFADRSYVMRLLGKLCARRGRYDCAIKCYEKCLEKDESLKYQQDLVGTLAELYQTKALLAKEDQPVYTHWMKLASDLYARCFEKIEKPVPFVQSSYGLFLCKGNRHSEAIEYLLNVIETPEDTSLSFNEEDKPLLDAHLAREIEARSSISLPLKVFAYHQLCTAYVVTNQMEKAQESALELENYVSRLQSSSEYSLILSIVGYAYKLVGNQEKAVNVLVSALEKMPSHPPLTEALEYFFLDLD